MNNLKLKLKKLIGKYIGYWCEYCGEPMEDYGYNFRTRCSDPDCLSHPEARKRFDTKGLKKLAEKHTEGYKTTYAETNQPKRGRPKKTQ